ncbi:874_t:CDS:2, partial [Cetraspora pellucida]
FFDSDDDYEKLLLSIQKAAYAEEMSIVEEAFEEIKQAAMKIQSTQRAEGSHSSLKKAIKAASRLDQVFSHIDHAFRQHQQQKNGALGLNIISADPFILNNTKFEQLVRKISRWAIDRIKKEICETQENYDNTNNSICNCSLRLNFKLPYHHIIPSTGPIPLSIIHPRWLLKHDSVPLLPSSLSTDTAFNKALYMLEEKYANLNDSRSKALLLHKIEALIAKEIVIPKAPVRTENIRRPASIKRDLLHSELQDKAAKKKEKNTPKFTTDLPKSDENEWSEIQKELQKELIKKEQFYHTLFLANDDYKTIMKEIS